MPRKSKKIEQGKGVGLGRALVKSKTKNRRNYVSKEQEQAVEVTATRIADPKITAASGLSSIIEQDDVSRLLTEANMAHRDFIAEKLTPELLVEYPDHAEVVDENGASFNKNFKKPILTPEELSYFVKNLVCVPRRPKWADGLSETATEFQHSEQVAFHDWLARLSLFETDTGVALTPFERNIEVWRQLWRVLERSHVVVQIVDSRNPLLYRCADLDRYVSELDDGKKSSILLLNKADLLSREQRRIWYEYFKSIGVNVLFYSAIAEENSKKSISETAENATATRGPSESTDGQKPHHDDGESVISDDRAVYKEKAVIYEKSKFAVIATEDAGEDSESESENDTETGSKPTRDAAKKNAENAKDSSSSSSSEDEAEDKADDDNELTRKVPEHVFQEQAHANAAGGEEGRCPWDILDNDSLLAELERFCEKKYGGTLLKTQKYVVGLCGFPNVGKSSTLNSLVGSKKVAVSATPGRTKHFQTIHLTDTLILCDSPGLVMPTLARNNAELVVNGILPIDQLREPLSPIELIYKRIDHSVLEQMYGVTLTPWFTAIDFLLSVGFQRGFMSSSGRPDFARVSRIVLRHYTSGKLLYCTPPPKDFIDPEKFFSHGLKCCFVENPSTSRRQLGNRIFQRRTGINVDGDEAHLDQEFFSGAAHVVGVRNGRAKSAAELDSKPWKKHHNGNKREKLRRKFVHLEA